MERVKLFISKCNCYLNTFLIREPKELLRLLLLLLLLLRRLWNGGGGMNIRKLTTYGRAHELDERELELELLELKTFQINSQSF